MTSYKIRRTATCFMVMIVLPGARLAAQDKPDFSGSWTLESRSSGPEIPQTLLVSQSITRTDVRGEPTKPFFKDITVTRALASGTHSDTYEIGVMGGTVFWSSRWKRQQSTNAPPRCLGGPGPRQHTLVPKPATGRFPYPRYEILTAKGITEVIEHRRMEPIFYIVDDLQVKRQLGVQ